MTMRLLLHRLTRHTSSGEPALNETKLRHGESGSPGRTEAAPLDDIGAKMKERKTPTALLGISVETVRERFGARWPQPVQRWLKNASVAEVAIWLEANSADELARTNREQETLSSQG
jgi:hypothetical protein